MKKLLPLFAAAGIALFTSCEKEPEPSPEEKPFPIGDWRTTHQYFDLKVDGPKEIKEELEQEISIEVPETQSYQLTFDKNGSGNGSIARHSNNGRFGFQFEWELSDGNLSLRKIDNGYYAGLFFSYDGSAHAQVEWVVEESDADKMVLSMVWHVLADGEFYPWYETHTYRYTFEKLKPGEQQIKSSIEPNEPTLVSAWRTTHQHFSRTIDQRASDSQKEELNVETSVAVTDAESYKLKFNESGTGYGSGSRYDGTGRDDFDFTWYSSHDNVYIPEVVKSWFPFADTKGGAAGTGVSFNGDWDLEELTTDKMVLTKRGYRVMEELCKECGWTQTDTYRYTFEKIK